MEWSTANGLRTQTRDGRKGNNNMMRQDRFTEQAQEVLQASQEMVRQHRHAQWDVEHVFLALLSHKDGLARADLPAPQRARRGRASSGRRGTWASAPKLGYDVVQIYTTPRVVRMLEAANAEAERLKDEFVGVEHLLIAIADEREGESARILREYQVDKERIYRALQEVRGSARVQTPRRREPLPGAGEVRHRPHGGGAPGQARPGDRPRGRGAAGDADPEPAHEEQPGDHR